MIKIKKKIKKTQLYSLYSKARNMNKQKEDVVRIYPTLRCNLKCSYCVNNYDPANWKGSGYQEISADQWLDIIKRINKNVIITGGEPTLYKDFYKLVNGIPAHLNVKFYSNLTFDPNEFIANITREVSVLGSYHPCGDKIENIMNSIKVLAENNINGFFHIINTPENKKAIESFFKFDPENRWKVCIDVDQRDYFECSLQKEKRKVFCRRRIILVAPDGVRYPCVAGIVSRRWALEDLKTKQIKKYWTRVICDNWGHCAPCDGLGNNKIKFLK